jgi:hypothetical protein
MRHDFAEIIDYLIAHCDKSQVEIARALGYENANIITMFKKGTTRVPLAKVGPLADILGVDRTGFLKLWFEVYRPEEYASLQTYWGMMLSPAERSWIVGLREEFAPAKVPAWDSRTKGAVAHLAIPW